jgi:hypothetical protein
MALAAVMHSGRCTDHDLRIATLDHAECITDGV